MTSSNTNSGNTLKWIGTFCGRGSLPATKIVRAEKSRDDSKRTHSTSGFGCFFLGSTSLTTHVETKVVKAIIRNTCSGSKS